MPRGSGDSCPAAAAAAVAGGSVAAACVGANLESFFGAAFLVLDGERETCHCRRSNDSLLFLDSILGGGVVTWWAYGAILLGVIACIASSASLGSYYKDQGSAIMNAAAAGCCCFLLCIIKQASFATSIFRFLGSPTGTDLRNVRELSPISSQES